MATLHVDALASDVDGTLVGTLDLARECQRLTVAEAVTKKGFEHLAPKSVRDYMQAVRPFFGTGPHSELTGAIGALLGSHQEQILKAEADALVRRLFELEDEHDELIVHFGWLSEFLTAIGHAGWPFAMVTSGVAHFVYQSMGGAMGLNGLHLNRQLDDVAKTALLRDAFWERHSIRNSTLVSYNDVDGLTKPHIRPLEVAFERLGCEPRRAGYIGDDVGDMLPAAKLGVRVRIGILHPPNPLRTADELVAAGATHIVYSLAEASYLLGL